MLRRSDRICRRKELEHTSNRENLISNRVMCWTSLHSLRCIRYRLWTIGSRSCSLMRARSVAWSHLQEALSRGHAYAIPSSSSTATRWRGKDDDLGYFTFFGSEDLCRIHGTLDSEFFLAVLNAYVLDSLNGSAWIPRTQSFSRTTFSYSTYVCVMCV